MFYAFLFALWLIAIYVANGVTNTVIAFYNYQTWPWADGLLLPTLILVWASFVWLSYWLFKLGRKHYLCTINRSKVEAETPAPETATEALNQEKK